MYNERSIECRTHAKINSLEKFTSNQRSCCSNNFSALDYAVSTTVAVEKTFRYDKGLAPGGTRTLSYC